VVIDIIDIKSMTFIESKCHAPILRDPNRMVTLQVAAERVKSEARQVHVLRGLASVQGCENIAQLLDMLRGDAPCRPALIKGLQPSMPDRSDHPMSVFCRLSLVKRQTLCELRAAEFRAIQAEMVAQRVEQRRLALDV
jgi:hypothetical protein